MKKLKVTLSQHIKECLKLQEGGYGDFPLFYSTDDEGNEYKKVIYTPYLEKLDFSDNSKVSEG